jgi:hypothetical protein
MSALGESLDERQSSNAFAVSDVLEEAKWSRLWTKETLGSSRLSAL